ncbi:MAG: YhgE/Pip domain-containing protein [Betaproteobacteria bacterium]
MFQILRKLLLDTATVARADLGLLKRFPRLAWVLPAIVVIPALYAFIYLDSVWDPASRTGALPVAIVNLDEGAAVADQRFELGRELVNALETRRNFDYQQLHDTALARQGVRSGRYVFALIIPEDFSVAAVAPSRPGAGSLVVFASEGNNYLGAGFARRFASELGHQVNESLNERRWAIVLGNTASSRDRLQQWRDGMSALRGGAIELEQGLGALRQGAVPMAQGAARAQEVAAGAAESLRQTGQALRALEARRPSASDLAALKDGVVRLNTGHAELQQGLRRLEDGASDLSAGIVAWRADVAPIPLLGDRALESTEPLLGGATTLRAGVRLARESSAALAGGVAEFGMGVTQLVDGLSAQGAGVAALSARLPSDERQDEAVAGSRTLADSSAQLRDGSAALHKGSVRLASGLDTLYKALPASLEGPQGSASGLAATVEPRLEIDAPVPNNGMGFLPNFIPVALWLGAVMTAFVFHLRRIPVRLQGCSRVSLLLGKMGVLGGINLAQAACVLLMCELLLGLQPVHATGLALTMACSALTFMLLILLLVRLLGDAGKGAALVLLIVQLSAAGGVMPIELTSEFYAAISPWLPFTWSVRAVRASAFGAFGDEWGSALSVLLMFTAVFTALLLLVGRWRFVPDGEHRPALDV